MLILNGISHILPKCECNNNKKENIKWWSEFGKGFTVVRRNFYLLSSAGALLDWYWDFSSSSTTTTTTQEQGNNNNNNNNQHQDEMILVKAGVTSTGPLSFLYKLLLKTQIEKAYDEINVNFKKICEEKMHQQEGGGGGGGGKE